LFKPEKESHLVYVLYNSLHLETKDKIKECQQGLCANLLYLRDSEGRYFPLNLRYQETILKLAKKAGIYFLKSH
jgi:hypothetical protein